MKTSELIDLQGRRITYLRVSLTDKCNLRCSYCYGLDDFADTGSSGLSFDEISALLEIFSLMGISKVRFTGGEPLLRRDIISLVRRTSSLTTLSQIGLTTNGLLLERSLDQLIDAGLNCLNISLDSLNRHTFEQITGINGFDRVMAGIDMSLKCGAFERVKINTVIMRGINDREIGNFAEWALARNIDLRFIEYMPAYLPVATRDLYMSEAEIKEKIGLNLTPIENNNHNAGPAESYYHNNFPGRISFISAVSRSFCRGCNRLRLTSKGELIGCLFRHSKVDLKRMLDEGAHAADIVSFVKNLVRTAEFRRTAGAVSVGEHQPFMRGVGG